MQFPNIDPVALELGPLVIRWYALAYVFGILIGQWLVLKLDDRRGQPLLSKDARENLVAYAVLGILLGGRFGYIVFYNLDYYLAHPAHIFAIWQGGMSFHGGLLGVLGAFWLFARKYKISWLALMDRLAVVTPIGLLFGRLANFINGELYGRVTDAPWGMVFPTGGPLPRHPSQLYEAGLEGLVLFVVLWTLATTTRAIEKPGLLGGVFIAGYGLARFTIEFFREPDAQLGLLVEGLSMGQLLCLPMMTLGFWLVARTLTPKRA